MLLTTWPHNIFCSKCRKFTCKSDCNILVINALSAPVCLIICLIIANYGLFLVNRKLEDLRLRLNEPIVPLTNEAILHLSTELQVRLDKIAVVSDALPLFNGETNCLCVIIIASV